jgi:uncharacterized protein
MKSYLVDANVWVALAYAGHLHHSAARAWFSGLDRSEAVFCRLTHLAVLRILTTKAAMRLDTLSLDEAWKVYDVLRTNPRSAFAEEPPNLEHYFRRLAQSPRPEPKALNDSYLAAFATASGLGLASFDNGFGRFPDLDWIRPGA